MIPKAAVILPLAAGGLGLRFTERLRHAAQWASWVDMLQALSFRYDEEEELTPPIPKTGGKARRLGWWNSAFRQHTIFPAVVDDQQVCPGPKPGQWRLRPTFLQPCRFLSLRRLRFFFFCKRVPSGTVQHARGSSWLGWGMLPPMSTWKYGFARFLPTWCLPSPF